MVSCSSTIIRWLSYQFYPYMQSVPIINLGFLFSVFGFLFFVFSWLTLVKLCKFQVWATKSVMNEWETEREGRVRVCDRDAPKKMKQIWVIDTNFDGAFSQHIVNSKGRAETSCSTRTRDTSNSSKFHAATTTQVSHYINHTHRAL